MSKSFGDRFAELPRYGTMPPTTPYDKVVVLFGTLQGKPVQESNDEG